LQGFEPSIEPVFDDNQPAKRNSRSAEKRKMKAKLKIHASRGKKK